MKDILFSEEDMTFQQFTALALRLSAKDLLGHSATYDAGEMVNQDLRQINRALNNREFKLKSAEEKLEVIQTIHDRSLVNVIYISLILVLLLTIISKIIMFCSALPSSLGY